MLAWTKPVAYRQPPCSGDAAWEPAGEQRGPGPGSRLPVVPRARALARLPPNERSLGPGFRAGSV